MIENEQLDTNTRDGQLVASAMLARLMGWEILRSHYSNVGRIEFTSINVIGDVSLFNEVGDTLAFRGKANFYHCDNMALAWRVLNWATSTIAQKKEQAMSLNDMDLWCYWREGEVGLREIMGLAQKLGPAEAQRAWLDKILSLAIEAGMVQE